jgi:phage gp29-like protein
MATRNTSKTTRANLPPLDSEAATRQQDPWNQDFMGQVRTNDPLLLERGDAASLAFELYRDLRRDGKVFAGLQKRKLAVVGRPWTVAPQVDTPAGQRDAKIVTDILGGFAFDRMCASLLNALLVGWQPAEVVWTLRDVALEGGGARQMVVPDRVPSRLHRRFIYRDTDAGGPLELRLLTREAMQDGIPVHERKFIVHVVEPEDGNPYGTGLGLQLFWPVFFKRKGVIAWNKLCDRFGTPTPWGKYPREASPREKGTLYEALRAFSNDGFVMTPEGTMIELLEAKLAASETTPNQSLVEYMDDWISEVLLGQPPRGGGGGALAAAANEREDVRLELSQADSDLLSDTLNKTLLAWICDYNGLEPCVVYRRLEKDEDTKALSEIDVNVASMGFRPTEQYIKDRYGEGWEAAPEMARAAPAPAGDGGGQGRKPASFAEGADGPDAIDRLVDEELGQWRQVVEPMAAPLRALLERADKEGWTAGQLLANLPELLGQMDDAALTQALTRAAFAARVGAASGLENE